MDFVELRRIIAELWPGCPLEFGGSPPAAGRLEDEFGFPLPEEARDYAARFLPPRAFALETLDGTMTVFGCEDLTARPEGFARAANVAPSAAAGSPLAGWDASWLLVALRAQGSRSDPPSPLVIDLALPGPRPLLAPGRAVPVTHSGPANGRQNSPALWRFEPLASSLARGLACAFAVHHALTGLCPQAVVTQKRFLRPAQRVLAKEAAAWLLPRLRTYEPLHWRKWLAGVTVEEEGAG